MKIFISWSGKRSKKVAEVLGIWLKDVIQILNPFVSSEDIRKGARWLFEISYQLEGARVGIICLTKENVNAPWILFEAGSLAKTVDSSFVIPYLLDISPSNITGPLSQFQSALANKEDTYKLLSTINDALKELRLPDEQLKKAFKKWWPELERSLNSIIEETVNDLIFPSITHRPDRELIEEILDILRKNRTSFSLNDIQTLQDYRDVICDANTAVYGPHIKGDKSFYNYVTRRLLDAFCSEAYQTNIKKKVVVSPSSIGEDFLQWHEETNYLIHHVMSRSKNVTGYHTIGFNFSSFAPGMAIEDWKRTLAVEISVNGNKIFNNSTQPILEKNLNDDGAFCWKEGDWISFRFHKVLSLTQEWTTVKVIEKSINHSLDTLYSLNNAHPVLNYSIDFLLPENFTFLKEQHISPKITFSGLPALIKNNINIDKLITTSSISNNHLNIEINDWILPGIILNINWYKN